MMWDSAIFGGRTSLPKVLHLGTMCTFLTTSALIIAQTMCVRASYPPPFKYKYLKNHLSEIIESKKNPFKQFMKANFVWNR